jgi:hypothetical protein
MDRRTGLKSLLRTSLGASIARLACKFNRMQTETDTTLPKRGKLYVMIGNPQVGKTSLGKAMAKRHNLALLDDVHRLTFPDRDCEILVRHGHNVLAIIGGDCSSDEASAAAPGSVRNLWHSADWLFQIAYRRNDNQYACTTLKDQRGRFPNAFVWTSDPNYVCFMSGAIDSDLL